MSDPIARPHSKSFFAKFAELISDTLTSQVVTLWRVFKHLFVATDTVQYPEQQPSTYRPRVR